MLLNVLVPICLHNFISGYLTLSSQGLQLLFQIPVQNTCIYNRDCSFLSLIVRECYKQPKQHFEAQFLQLFSFTAAFRRQHLKQSCTLSSPFSLYPLCFVPPLFSAQFLWDTATVAGWAALSHSCIWFATQAQLTGMPRPHRLWGREVPAPPQVFHISCSPHWDFRSCSFCSLQILNIW